MVFTEGRSLEGLLRVLATLFPADELAAGEPPPEEPAGLPNQELDLDLDMLSARSGKEGKVCRCGARDERQGNAGVA